MITLLSAYGNHSNRLFQMIHFEAYAKENKRKFITICFDDMYEIYGLKCHPLRNKLVFFLFRVLRKLKLYTQLDFDADEHFEEYTKRLSKEKISFVSGWYFRRNDLTIKYREYFKNKYSIADKYIINNNFVNTVLKKANDEKIIGVHIRRGDYKIWQDGKYYFSDEIYLNFINKIKEVLFKNELKPKFIIFTNGDIEIKESDEIKISHEEWYVDHYLMSKCDYLIGPPSTFTSWASYIGKVPLLFIDSKDMNFTLKDFKVIDG